VFSVVKRRARNKVICFDMGRFLVVIGFGPAYYFAFDFRKAHSAMPQRYSLVKLDAAAAG
jgi:hypothetical protein